MLRWRNPVIGYPGVGLAESVDIVISPFLPSPLLPSPPQGGWDDSSAWTMATPRGDTEYCRRYLEHDLRLYINIYQYIHQ